MTQDEKIKSKIQELLISLNLIALEVNLDDYGLPIYDKDANRKMSERVYAWVINIVANTDKREYMKGKTE